MAILYLEDDPAIGQAVADFLQTRQLAVTRCATIEAARQAAAGCPPDLLLLDWNLPDGSGAAFCRELRARCPALPILMLTVRGGTQDILAGFESGADDYVTKPFDREILYARLLALLRRSRTGDAGALRCGDIQLDAARQTVTRRGMPVSLGPLEYRLLWLLLQNKGRTVTRRQLLSELWDQNGQFVNDNTLTVTMKRLREKLGQPACLKTVRSFGYRMEEETP